MQGCHGYLPTCLESNKIPKHYTTIQSTELALPGPFLDFSVKNMTFWKVMH